MAKADNKKDAKTETPKAKQAKARNEAAQDVKSGIKDDKGRTRAL